MRRNVAGIVWGIILLIGGLLLLLQQTGVLRLEWGNIWPAFIVLAGVVFWLGFTISERREPGLAFVGTLLILSGIFLGLFAFGVLDWSDMNWAWGWWWVIGGVSFAVLWAVRRFRDWSALFWALIGLVVGFIVIAGFPDVWRFWPLALILAGVFIMVQAFTRRAPPPE